MHSGPPPTPQGLGPDAHQHQSREAGKLRSLDDFRLHDVEAMRLILRGGSVIDWHRLDCPTEEQARQLVEDHGLSLDNPDDVLFIEHIKESAIGYLRRHFNFAMPPLDLRFQRIDSPNSSPWTCASLFFNLS